MYPASMKSYALSAIHCTMVLFANVYSIPAHIVWIVCLTPLRFMPWMHSFYWSCEAFLFNSLLSMITTWYKVCQYTIIEMGDDVSSLYNQRVLLLANHQSTADVPTIMSLCQMCPGVGGRTYWIMDYIFRYTHFGLVSTLRSDFFIREGKAHRERTMESFRDHLHASYIPNYKKWLILFPEGGFLRKRREVSKSFARKNNYPVLEHVTLPRTGALKVILDTLVNTVSNGCTTQSHGSHSQLDWVIDLTIAYPGGEPIDIVNITCATHAPCEVICHYRAYPISDIPKDTEAMTKWLFARYEEKNNMLEQYYTTGKFPQESRSSRKLPLRKAEALNCSWVRLVGYHTFFIVSTYLHLLYFYKPLFNLVVSVFI